MNYTLAELAGIASGRRERKKALSDAIHDYADLWGKTLVIDAFLKVLSEGAQAVVVAEILAAAKRSGQGKAYGFPAGVGEVVINGVGVGHGSSSENATVAGE